MRVENLPMGGNTSEDVIRVYAGGGRACPSDFCKVPVPLGWGGDGRLSIILSCGWQSP